ncbi:hypothetical protein RJT34_33461 [Clitoria ternatea]|uniref:Remorin C-terminal domain-containing protein n=1 Tax=Clitoria ternatea TaxID=43366 RepID=A0AAN9I4M9_CLITE
MIPTLTCPRYTSKPDSQSLPIILNFLGSNKLGYHYVLWTSNLPFELSIFIRASFSDPQSPKHHVSSSSRNDNAWNWFQRTTFHDDCIRDDEYVTSIAATAFAIHSLEEAESRKLQKVRENPKPSRTQTMRRKEDNIPRLPSYGETSIKGSFGQDTRPKASPFPVRSASGISSPRLVSPAIGYQKQQGTPFQNKNFKTKPETWKKTKTKMIQKQYEKMKSKCLSWEIVKKIQAKLQIERKKRAMEKQNYRNKIARGARVHSENKSREEFQAREKTNKIPKTSKVSVKCLCFNS